MATPYWLVLPLSWELGNVRAVFALLINLLTTTGLWVVAYAMWKSGALRASKSQPTKLLSLLSMTGLGDAVDALVLLRPVLGPRLLASLLFQSAIVILLSAVAIFSGPIAQYSTRSGITVRHTPVSGWLATTNHSSMGNAFVRWNATIERLKAAEFPRDQLLDYLPNNQIDWTYRESEWNSSWLSSCQWTDRTPIALTATGNYTSSGDIFSEVPSMKTAFPAEAFVGNITAASDFHGTFENRQTFKDLLVFVIVQTNPESPYASDEDDNTNFQPLNLSIAAFHLHHVPRPSRNLSVDTVANFGVGPIERSWYTLANCQIRRAPLRGRVDLTEDAEAHIAFPWTTNVDALATALAGFHQAPVVEQSFNGDEIYHPPGQDLFRFYQAYTVCKDTQYKQAVSRDLSVAVPTVELAVPALAVLALYVLGLVVATVWFVAIRRLPSGTSIPRTKVEWIMHTLREVGGREVDRGMLDSPLHDMRDDLRSAIYGQTYSEQGRPHKSVQLELKDEM